MGRRMFHGVRTPETSAEFEKKMLNKQREAFAGAAGFDEFGRREFMQQEAALTQYRAELRVILRQYNVLAQDNCVTGKVRCFLGGHFDQIGNMLANCPLRILVEGRRIPNGAPFGERTETGVQMVIAVLDQFDREDQAVQELCELVV